MEPLADTDAVIKALGGTYAVSQILGCRMQNVSNWRGKVIDGRRIDGHFPPETFETFSRELVKRGLSARLSLWRMIPTAQLEGMIVIPDRASVTGALDAPCAAAVSPRSTSDLALERSA